MEKLGFVKNNMSLILNTLLRPRKKNKRQPKNPKPNKKKKNNNLKNKKKRKMFKNKIKTKNLKRNRLIH